MTAEATKTTRIRATQTQIGNKSLQPTDKPPRTQGSRMFQISFEGRRRQDIYISIREPSSQGAGRPVAFHPVRSAAAGRSEGDHGARRDRGTSETTGQERPRRPTRTQNRRNHGARPLFEEPPPDTAPEDRRLAHRRIPPPKRQKRLFPSKKAAADLVFQNFLVYLYPDNRSIE